MLDEIVIEMDQSPSPVWIAREKELLDVFNISEEEVKSVLCSKRKKEVD